MLKTDPPRTSGIGAAVEDLRQRLLVQKGVRSTAQISEDVGLSVPTITHFLRRRRGITVASLAALERWVEAEEARQAAQDAPPQRSTKARIP